MKTFKEKVARRVRWWMISSVLALAALLSLGYAFFSLVTAVEDQRTFILLVGATFVALSFFAGQVAERVLVRNWDTWMMDLGPLQIDVLVEALNARRRDLEEKK